MSSRMKFPDVRWFADRRPVCIIEFEHMKQLNAKNDFQYAEQLQKEGMKIFDEKIRKTPKLSISAINQ